MSEEKPNTSRSSMLREVLGGLAIRSLSLGLPFVLVADFATAAGKKVNTGVVVFGMFCVFVMIAGLVVDLIRSGRRRTHPELVPKLRSNGLLQVRLRTVFLMLTLAAVYCSFRFGSAVRHHRAVTELRNVGVPVEYDYPASTWLASLFGEQMFGAVRHLTLRSDGEVSKVGALPEVRSLLLYGPGITDGAVDDVVTLQNLERVRITGTKISNQGVARLKQALPSCEIVIMGQ